MGQKPVKGGGIIFGERRFHVILVGLAVGLPTKEQGPTCHTTCSRPRIGLQGSRRDFMKTWPQECSKQMGRRDELMKK
jgi:hypothetical protein